MSSVSKKDRQHLNGHKSLVLWFTGLSGSGKTTLAQRVETELLKRGIRSYILDGDNVRMGLNRDLGFSAKDREENVRRIGEVARLFVDAGIVVLTAFISPFRKDRDFARSLVEKNEFVEIYLKCPLHICEERDVKGLYRKARQGSITQFTGIDDPYEKPDHPEIVLDTGKTTVAECLNRIMVFLEDRFSTGH
jgi:adenylylsulfate kinase